MSDVTPRMKTAIDRFELQAAKQVWDALDEEAGGLLRHALGGGIWPEYDEVEDPRGSIMRAGKRYDRVRREDPLFGRLMALGLMCWGQAEGNWGVNGPPLVHVLTEFGRIVARYGNAVHIVALATGEAA